jgi:DNA-directed RNA polymerase subunit M/transcription elongation factor TFIIS
MKNFEVFFKYKKMDFSDDDDTKNEEEEENNEDKSEDDNPLEDDVEIITVIKKVNVDCDTIRNKTKIILTQHINDNNNVIAMEKSIYNSTVRYSKSHNIKLQSPEFIKIYRNISYDTYSKLLEQKLDVLKKELMHDKILWESEVYNNYKEERDMELYKIENPENSNIQEGIFTCGKCQGKRIAIRSMQTRSGDEATTIFYTCIACGNKWKS